MSEPHTETIVLVCAAVAALFFCLAPFLIRDRRTEAQKQQDEQERFEEIDKEMTPKVDPNEPARWVP